MFAEHLDFVCVCVCAGPHAAEPQTNRTSTFSRTSYSRGVVLVRIPSLFLSEYSAMTLFTSQQSGILSSLICFTGVKQGSSLNSESSGEGCFSILHSTINISNESQTNFNFRAGKSSSRRSWTQSSPDVPSNP